MNRPDHTQLRLALLFLLTFGLSSCWQFDDPTLDGALLPESVAPVEGGRSVPFEETRNLLWGDLHVHTAYSYDAFTMGTRGLPDDAYEFMKGGTVQHALGYPIRARRPLDFGAVTDHAEYMGIPRHLAGSAANDPSPIADAVRSRNRIRLTWMLRSVISSKVGSRETRDEVFGRDDLGQVSKSAWQDIIDAAERHNDPGRFTTFIAYEWSSVLGNRNLHRNVIYGSDQVPEMPFSSRDSLDPEDLWRALDRQREEGMEVLAIPHNSNLSDGSMFGETRFGGAKMDAQYASMRSRNEPLVEIFQIKGTSETHPELSPADAFSDFELMERLLAAETAIGKPSGSYAREALAVGLALKQSEGFNPYQFGLIGSSDSHNASSSVEEDNFHGKLPLLDGTPAQRLGLATLIPWESLPTRAYGAAGLIGVWARENSRSEIFEAMSRKEVYATSGPRISVRFFAGREFAADPFGGDWLEAAYREGVPMGGRLAVVDRSSPTFLVSALRDPIGANLDRVQIVKVWVDARGVAHERIYDVAASDGRHAGEDGVVRESVGSTVDRKLARYTNTIGAAELRAIWRDEDFDPLEDALYYARVLEIPTPRHTTYAASLLGVEAPEPFEIQERAVTSPIWCCAQP